MATKIDPAILSALSLSSSTVTIFRHGGSGFSETYKLTSNADTKPKNFFIKIGTGKDAEAMFAGEHTSLNAIHDFNPSLCPKSYAHGPLSSGGFFLATTFLTLSSSPPSPSAPSLAQKLAKLHSTPAPIHPGYSTPQFGFPLPTCCGSTEQPNTYSSSWPTFYVENRLRPILSLCNKRNGKDSELSSLMTQIIDHVVPALLREGHLKDGKTGGNITPVIVHGDLWAGNQGQGRLSGDGPVEDVVFDPSSCYAHSEYEAGIMNMFGGFNGQFWKEYFEIKVKDEPREEYEDRVALYGLYHHLNHYAIFGVGYKGGAVSIMKKLVKKYGDWDGE